ncbi:hypothetical protein [Streptomyces cucumeris]|uniref:hypothetical protein n=1 Tax=Streptomyces cucumeris TaxID=2962890 RepID=UPI003D708221
MQKKNAFAATAVAVLALTLTGCADDGDSASPARKDGASATRTAGGDRTDSSPSAGSSPTAREEAGGGRHRGAGRSPATSAAPRPTRSSAAPAPAPSRTRTTTAAPTRPASPSGVQGMWYVPVRGGRGLATLNVSGTSFTLAYAGKSCSGTISSAMAVSSTCAGETSNGTAVVSNGGENLTFNWTTGEPDRFVRTKPAG